MAISNDDVKKIILGTFDSKGGVFSGPSPGATLISTTYDAFSDAYVDEFSDGSRRVRRLNAPRWTSVYEPIPSGTYVVPAGFARSVSQFVEKPQPVAEKSPEELMDDALDAAVRAARKAV